MFTDSKVLDLSVKILGEMMRSNAYNEVPPEAMCAESVEMAIMQIEHLKTLKESKK